MSDKYIPKVGDWVKEREWNTPPVEVTYVGTDLIVGKGSREDCWALDRDWIKVEPKVPLPERWVNVYPDEMSTHFSRVDDASGRRIAVIHVYTDADGTDHADIERCQP